MGLRFGIHSGPQNASGFDEYLSIWRFAEEAGLDWASVFDHFQPIQSDPDGPCYEGFTLLAAMAAHTTRLACGIIVSGVTYRHPAVVAKMAATIDHVSGGRMEFGVGAAWNEDEHREYGIPFPRIGVRMDMLDEACHVMRRLWTEPRASFAGKHFTLTEARAEPKPLQDPMPLWIGGSGEQRTLRIVAEHATGWNTFHGDPAEYRHKLDVLERHCEAVGRDPATIRKQIVARGPLTTDAEAERLAEAMLPHKAMGVEDFLISARPPADLRTIELFARVVGPAVRAG
jgi:F420-dependent oxidoreductase-like protein